MMPNVPNTNFMLIMVLLFTGCVSNNEPQIPSVDRYLPSSDELISQSKVTDPNLSLSQCIEISLSKSPLAQAAYLGIESARRQVGIAESSYYPQIKAQAHHVRRESRIFLPSELENFPMVSKTVGPTDDDAISLSMDYLVYDAGRRRAQLLRSKSDAMAAEMDAKSVDLDLAVNVADAYFMLLSANEALKTSELNKARADQNLDLVRQKQQTGMAVRKDVLRAKTRQADEQLTLVKAQSRVSIAETNLLAAMGLPPNVRVNIRTLKTQTLASTDNINMRAALSQAVHTRPEIKSALRTVSSRIAQVEGAESEFGPNLQLRGKLGRRDTNFWPEDNDWAVGIYAEWPLFTGRERTSKLQQSQFELNRQEARVKQLILDVQQNVKNSLDRLTEAYQAFEASRVFREHATASLHDIRISYREGMAGLTELLDAQTESTNAELEVVRQKWSYFSAKAQFMRSIGLMPDQTMPAFICSDQ